MPVFPEAVEHLATCEGTRLEGDYVLGAIIPGCFALDDSADDGDEVCYSAQEIGGSHKREIGRGVFDLTTGTVSRDHIYRANDGIGFGVDWLGTEQILFRVVWPGAKAEQLQAIFDAIATNAQINGLNARYLQGNSASAFALAGHLHAGVYVPVTPTVGSMPGRLSLSSTLHTPVADVTGATLLYYLPVEGNRVDLWNGTYTTPCTLADSGIVVNVSGALSANTNYDVFLEPTSSFFLNMHLVAWSGATTPTALAVREGYLVRASDHTYRYAGAVRTDASGTLVDSVTKRYVVNEYNQRFRVLRKHEHAATVSWPYTTATWRQARAEANNRVEVLIARAEQAVQLKLLAGCTSSSTPANAIGLDATNAPATNSLWGFGAAGGAFGTVSASYDDCPGVGHHQFNWLEFGNTGATFYGTQGSSPPIWKYGLSGGVWC